MAGHEWQKISDTNFGFLRIVLSNNSVRMDELNKKKMNYPREEREWEEEKTKAVEETELNQEAKKRQKFWLCYLLAMWTWKLIDLPCISGCSQGKAWWGWEGWVWRGSTNKLTQVASDPCWLLAGIPCHVCLSIRALTVWQLASQNEGVKKVTWDESPVFL